jgi:hypothetical protein
MLFIDLNSDSPLRHTSVAKRKEMAYEFWENDFLSADGFFTYLRIQEMR